MNLLSGLVVGALVGLLVLTALLRAQGIQERYVLADLRKENQRLQRRVGALRVECDVLSARLAPQLDPLTPRFEPELQG